LSKLKMARLLMMHLQIQERSYKQVHYLDICSSVLLIT